MTFRSEYAFLHCQVHHWRDNSIEIRVPNTLQDYAHKKNKKWIIWVKLAGMDIGPTYEIDGTRIEGWAPRIAYISSNELRPRGRIEIVGEWFFEKEYMTGSGLFGGNWSRYGDVQLWHIPGRGQPPGSPTPNIATTIHSWTDSRIELVLLGPEWPAERAEYTLVITTSGWGRVEHPVTMLPLE